MLSIVTYCGHEIDSSIFSKISINSTGKVETKLISVILKDISYSIHTHNDRLMYKHKENKLLRSEINDLINMNETSNSYINQVMMKSEDYMGHLIECYQKIKNLEIIMDHKTIEFQQNIDHINEKVHNLNSKLFDSISVKNHYLQKVNYEIIFIL